MTSIHDPLLYYLRLQPKLKLTAKSEVKDTSFTTPRPALPLATSLFLELSCLSSQVPPTTTLPPPKLDMTYIYMIIVNR